MKEIGLIGFGSFGSFIAPYLVKYFDLCVYDRISKGEQIKAAGGREVTLEYAASRDFVILCIPVQFLGEMLHKIKGKVKPGAVIFDVSSVKVKPLQLMKESLPSYVEIVGLHPLFGPQSGKNGIDKLNIVLCPTKIGLHTRIYRFLADELQLTVLERTPDLHDEQMGYVQALTHFIGRAINEMDIPDVEQKTPAYQYLLNIKRNLGKDSLDLFLTIEKENPYAKGIRERLIKELTKLNDWLGDEEV